MAIYRKIFGHGYIKWESVKLYLVYAKSLI